MLASNRIKPIEKTIMLLNVKKSGNSLSLIIPKEIAANLNIDHGDTLSGILQGTTGAKVS